MGSSASKPRPARARSEPPLAVSRPPAPKKILILGTSDSGKSTILKQIQAIYSDEIDTEDRSSWAETISENVRESIQHLIERMDAHGVWLSHHAILREHARTISRLPGGYISLQAAETIRLVWCDTLTQRFVEAHRSEALLYDCSEHFLDKVVEIGRVDYWPTDEDILHCRRISTGISVWQGQIEATSVSVYDVGGTRSERKKWAHCFEGASVVLFCASLTDYGTFLREESTESRFTDALHVFEAIVNSSYLQNARIMLLLTKSDVFCGQLAEVPLNSFCDDFTAAPTTDNGIHYIRNRFLDLRHDRNKKINTFVLNVTNTEQVKRALSYIPGIVPEKVESPYGL